jgi:hypothetical protein
MHTKLNININFYCGKYLWSEQVENYKTDLYEYRNNTLLVSTTYYRSGMANP